MAFQPPASVQVTTEGLIQDPNFQAFVENILQFRVKDMQKSYFREIADRDEAWKKREEEINACEHEMKLRVQALNNQLAAAQVQTRYVFVFSGRLARLSNNWFQQCCR